MIRREARSVRLGEAIGYAILAYTNKLPEEERKRYRRQLTRKIRILKFTGRKKGEPIQPEHRRVLDGIDLSKLDFSEPESYKLVVDELMQLTYTAQRAREIQRGLLRVLGQEKI